MKIPEIITRYLEASNRFDAAAAADCFCPDARVHDEQHDYQGRASIESWASETSRKYQPQVEVRHAEAGAGGWRLTVRTAGSFPGSPVELSYTIALRDGQISSLNIS